MEALKEAAKREAARIIEEYRRGRLERIEKFLPVRGIAERELDALEKAFADAHERHPDLGAWVYLNDSPRPTGPGSLHFCELANRAAWTLAAAAGEDGWKSWLDVVVGYLLNNDLGEEYIRALQASHLDRPEGTTPETHPGVIIHGENYEIRHLSKASEHCCRWLQRRWREHPSAADSCDTTGAPSRRRPGTSETLCRRDAEDRSAKGRSATGNDSPVAENRLQAAMKAQGLNCPRTAEKVRALLRRSGEGKLKVDRTTIYRLVNGTTMRPNGLIWRALLEVLKVSAEEVKVPESVQPPPAQKT